MPVGGYSLSDEKKAPLQPPPPPQKKTPKQNQNRYNEVK